MMKEGSFCDTYDFFIDEIMFVYYLLIEETRERNEGRLFQRKLLTFVGVSWNFDRCTWHVSPNPKRLNLPQWEINKMNENGKLCHSIPSYQAKWVIFSSSRSNERKMNFYRSRLGKMNQEWILKLSRLDWTNQKKFW